MVLSEYFNDTALLIIEVMLLVRIIVIPAKNLLPRRWQTPNRTVIMRNCSSCMASHGDVSSFCLMLSCLTIFGTKSIAPKYGIPYVKQQRHSFIILEITEDRDRGCWLGVGDDTDVDFSGIVSATILKSGCGSGNTNCSSMSGGIKSGT